MMRVLLTICLALWCLPAAAEKRALLFDGLDDEIEVPAISLTGDFTFGCWFTVDSIAASDGAKTLIGAQVGYSDGLRFQFYGDPVVTWAPYIAINGNTTETGIPWTGQFAEGEWNHLFFVRSGTTGTYYLNNVEVANDTVSDQEWTPDQIGRSQTIREWDDKLFDMRFYQKALTSDERAAVYAGGQISTAPERWYRLNENGSGNPTIIDYGSESQNGTAQFHDTGTFYYLGSDVPVEFVPPQPPQVMVIQ